MKRTRFRNLFTVYCLRYFGKRPSYPFSPIFPKNSFSLCRFQTVRQTIARTANRRKRPKNATISFIIYNTSILMGEDKKIPLSSPSLLLPIVWHSNLAGPACRLDFPLRFATDSDFQVVEIHYYGSTFVCRLAHLLR